VYDDLSSGEAGFLSEVSDERLRLFFLFAGIMLVLFGLFVAVFYPPTVVGGKFGGEVFAFLIGGLGLFSGVGFLLGFINERVRMEEANVLEDGEAVENITKPLDGGREGIGVCIVCRKKLYRGDLIASCPSCGTAAHRDDFREWVHVKGTCPACGVHLIDSELQALP
jgi:hypothetical protein